MNIADVFFAARLQEVDSSDINRVGDKAGQQLGSRVGTAAKVAIGAVAGVVATGLAAATAQGVQLNEVLNNLQAETGATGDEWAAMQTVVRRENGRTTESLDEIASATKAMRQDLGLTGADIDKYADRIFDAGLVTHTSATEITKSVDDIVDGYHVGIDRALTDLDKLTVSQQRFGGSLEERLSVLPQLAGALNSLNRTEDDGIALLNAAAASGLDATDVQNALTAAVNKFKIPKDLRDIVGVQKEHGDKVQFAKDEVVKLEEELGKFVVPARLKEIVTTLNAIPDPIQRAAEAERIYAAETAKLSADPLKTILDTLTAIPKQQDRVTKAQELGLGKASIAWATLAGKIKATDGGLDSFTISTDESTGAIQKQADAIDSGPIRSFQLLGEKIGAFFADTGSNPIITGVASLGTILGGFAPNLSGKLAGGLLRGLKGVGLKVASALGIEFASSAVSGAASAGGEAIAKLTAKQIAARLAGGTISKALTDGLIGVTSPAREAAMAAASKGFFSRLGASAAGQFVANFFETTGIKGLATRLSAAALAQGGAFGTIFAGAAASAILLVPVAVLLVAIKFQTDIDKQGDALLGQTQEFVKSATDEAIQRAIENTQKQLDAVPEGFLNSYGVKTKIVNVLNTLIAEQNRRLAEGGRQGGEAYGDAMVTAWQQAHPIERAGDAMVAAWKRQGTVMRGTVRDIAGKIADDLSGVKFADVARRGALLLMGKWAQGFRDGRDAVDQAWQDMLDGLKHPISVTAETAKLLGRLMSRKLQEGIHSGDPAVKDQAQYTKQLIIDRLNDLRPRAGTLTRAAMNAVRAAMRSSDPDVRAAARAIYTAATQPLAPLPATATRTGHGFMANLIASLEASLPKLRTTAQRIAAQMQSLDNFAGKLKDDLALPGQHRAFGGPVEAGVPYTVGEYRPETFIPSVPGYVLPFALPHVQASGSGDGEGGPVTQTFNVTVNGSPNTPPTPFETARQLRRAIGGAGFAPRRRPAWRPG